MIYLYNSIGRNIYTKLDEIVDVYKNPIQNKEKYEQLEKTVGDNFKTFNSTMKLKQTKKAFKLLDKNENLNLNNKIFNSKTHLKSSSLELVHLSSSNNKTNQNLNQLIDKKPILISKAQNKFVNAFKLAVIKSKLFNNLLKKIKRIFVIQITVYKC